MNRYHLHLINAHIDADDSEGYDLPSLDDARTRAINGIRDVLREELLKGVLDLRGRIDIENSSGTVLMTVPFAEAVTIKSQG